MASGEIWRQGLQATSMMVAEAHDDEDDDEASGSVETTTAGGRSRHLGEGVHQREVVGIAAGGRLQLELSDFSISGIVPELLQQVWFSWAIEKKASRRCKYSP